jgi:polyisoprenyl-teichoic acid--peptidoglycan teichoic acid transferase
MIGVTLLIIVGGGVWAVTNTTGLLQAVVQPKILLALFVGNIVLFVFRVAVSIDAYRIGTGKPGGALREETAGVLVVIAAFLLILPNTYLGYVDMVTYRTLNAVFGPGTTTTTAAPASSSTTEGSTGSTAAAGGTTTTSTTTTTVPLWAGQERLNILLMGGDAGPGRTGIRTDTMMVVSIDPETGDTAMLQVPRNFGNMPLPPELGINDCNCFSDISNALYQYGLQHPEYYPNAENPGAAFIEASFEQLLGIPIHYYALVDLNGFVDMVNALGGVTIYVPDRVYDANYPKEDGTTEVIDIPVGEYHMDGHLALAYARSRHSSDDYNRMGRQRCVLEAMLQEANPVTLALHIGSLADAVTKYVTTDIPIDQLPNLVKLLPKVDSSNIVSVRFIPPDYVAGYRPDRYSIPDIEKIQETVSIATSLPASDAIAALGLQPLADTCGKPPEETTTTASSTTTTSQATSSTTQP